MVDGPLKKKWTRLQSAKTQRLPPLTVICLSENAHGARLHAGTWLQGDDVEPLSSRWQSLLLEYRDIG
jgi:hypothetical protein